LSNIDLDSLKVSHLNFINGSPKKPIKFNSSLSVRISTESEINTEDLKKLKDIPNNPVVVYDKSGKRSEKKIFEVRYRKNSKNMFTLVMRAEGGLPIKKFVSSDDVVPGISKILDVRCTCQEFDFLDIDV
jgi:tRNA pseudouridine synthase 10